MHSELYQVYIHYVYTMVSAINEHVSEVEIDKLVDVNVLYVSQMIPSRDSIFKEMYE